MPLADLFLTSPFGLFQLLFFALVIGLFFLQKYRLDSLRKEYANDPEVQIDAGWLSLRMQTRRPLRAASLVQAGGGKNRPQRWDASTTVNLGGLRLHLSQEGLLG